MQLIKLSSCNYAINTFVKCEDKNISKVAYYIFASVVEMEQSINLKWMNRGQLVCYGAPSGYLLNCILQLTF